MCFCFDYISSLFFFVVSLISFVVFTYSGFYIDVSVSSNTYINSRFFSVLFLFVLSMFFLVFSYSFLSLILGWDGLGVVSFLLVIFYNNKTSLNSGLITIFTNRLGDCFFILRIMFFSYGGFMGYSVFGVFSSLTFIVILVLGCFTKRAQIPFSSWLPFAIAAPTPVSSLVHSSTLVTAGVYVLLRFNFLFFDVFYYISFFSLITMFVSGFCSAIELDFKKVVAISTLSQLGFMIFTFSLGYGVFCFIHIIFHAFFKSILFLSTGSFIHLLLGEQDSRSFGCLSDSFFSKIFFNCRCFSLIGLPFTIGFYRKDIILGFSGFYLFSFFFILFFFSCCLTVSYSVRLIFMSSFFFSSFSPSFSFLENKKFFYPVLFLFIFCVFFGNTIMYYFLPVVFFSFFDLFIGIIVFFLGLLFFFSFTLNYSTNFYFSTITFLRVISTDFFSSKLNKFSFFVDFSWGEVLGGKGFSFFFYFFYFLAFPLFKMYVWAIPVFIFYFYMFY